MNTQNTDKPFCLTTTSEWIDWAGGNRLQRIFHPFDTCDQMIKNLGSFQGEWLPIITPQDAAYFGVWVNIEACVIATYCEGDISLEKTDSIEKLSKALQTALKFYIQDAEPAEQVDKVKALLSN